MLNRVLKYLVLSVLIMPLGCSSGSEPIYAEGHWVGETLSFHVFEDTIQDLWINNASCTGEDAFGTLCGFSINSEYRPNPVPISSGGNFAGSLYTDDIRSFEILSASFVDRESAQGIYRFSAKGCCTVEEEFLVYLETPLVGPSTQPDAGSAQDSISGPDSGNQSSDGGSLSPGGPGPISTNCSEGFTSTEFGGCTPDNAETYQVQSLTEMNRIRAYAGVEPLNADAAINEAALAHCQCYVNHYFDVYQATGLSPHQEDPSHEDCVAQDFWQRMTHFGYSGNASAEIMGFQSDPLQSTHGWMETLYHRIPIVDPSSRDVGYGLATRAETGCDTADFGSYDGADTNLEIVYPVDGQSGVATRWHGLESPQPPLPEGKTYPSGPIITLTVARGSNLVVDSYTFTDDTGAEIPSMFLTPANDSYLDRSTALYSVGPLNPMTQHTVVFKGSKNGSSWSKTWSFTTGADGLNWDYSF